MIPLYHALQTTKHMYRDNLEEGTKVKIVLKKDQGTGKLTKGIVKRILTKSKYHPRGIKVQLKDGQIGRVQKILSKDE